MMKVPSCCAREAVPVRLRARMRTVVKVTVVSGGTWARVHSAGTVQTHLHSIFQSRALAAGAADTRARDVPRAR